ncbi:hypothetical protein JCM10908_000533 [Rhodotorula pacifica]|uniref:proteasome regulatory particle lid subunit RPN3 n=1 Tax=Rhodotorula pacifica TaxID=1495444 RepID=UPI0031741B9B
MADVDMNAAAPAAENTPASTSTPPPPADPVAYTRADIHHNLALLNQAVSLLEPRLTTRALRSLAPIRKYANSSDEHKAALAQVIRSNALYTPGSERQKRLIDALGNPAPPPPPSKAAESTPLAASSNGMDIETDASSKSAETPIASSSGPAAAPQKKATSSKKSDSAPASLPKELASHLPEADAYLSLLVLLSLLDSSDYTAAQEYAAKEIEHFAEMNRRTMDQLASKFYFYWVRAHELNGDDSSALRPTLLAAQRTAALRRDDDLQATLLPLLLRNYLDHGLYEQADRLVSKTQFPEGTAQNSQLARWYYYLGRIRAIQLDYTVSHASLLQAIRRGPSDLSSAPGFFQHAHKLLVLVSLLMGEIPERKIFREPVLRKALRPYLEIAQAVRVGDIQAFNSALEQHSRVFTADRNLSLVHRLRHNVIKTALRTISLAYSRISLRDISAKLALDSEEDAEYIVAKAIRDGVVVAKVDHEKGEMTSAETGDVYSTGEPMKEFDRRIGFLLDLYNQSVKAMRYPLNAHSKELASADEARERERELAKEIEEGDSDAGLDGPGDMDSF